MPDSRGRAIVVREAQTPAEQEQVHQATARVFGRPSADPSVDPGPNRWRVRVDEARVSYPAHLRAAFEGDSFVGSDVIYERELRFGPRGEARLRTGCIAVVLTEPEHRLKGVGSALMWDAVRLARQREWALLLLGGIPDFYHRFGYVDVMERSSCQVDRERVAALADESGVTVRPAREDDVPALLTLYEQHYGARQGGFVRTPAEQRRVGRPRADGAEYVLALDRSGQPRGYLHYLRREPHRAIEAAADSWLVANALLRYQERMVAAAPPPVAPPSSPPDAEPPKPPTTLIWHLPPDSRTHFLLAEHVPLSTETRSRPRAGWLARPAHLPTLFREIVPALQARWRRAGLAWSGSLALDIPGDDTTDQPGDACVLQLASGRLELSAQGVQQAARVSVRLTPGAFTQLLFGHRPTWWIAGQPGNDVPDASRPLLETLFPFEPTAVVASDGF